LRILIIISLYTCLYVLLLHATIYMSKGFTRGGIEGCDLLSLSGEAD
jgi:hypothetical protein